MAKSQKRLTTKSTAQSSAVSPLMIGLVVGAAILIVGAMIAWQVIVNQPGQAAVMVDSSGFPFKGKADAPVTIVEIADYNCSHCRDFNLEKYPQLEKEYIDTGKVKFVVQPFHLWPQTELPTEAAWCAADQGKFFEYHHALFEKQGTTWGQGNLTELAGKVGLDKDKLGQCLSNGTHRDEVESSRQAAANQGVNSTPTFFINQQRVEGNQPIEVFKSIIDQELAKSK